jgi:Fe-S cluster assembly protein SufD
MATTTEEPCSQTRRTETRDWFSEQQAEALKVFENEPFPARTDEMWRFSSIKNLAINEFPVAGEFSADVQSVLGQRKYQKPAGRIVFANESLVSAELYDDKLAAAGVIFTTLADALVSYSDLLREHFMAQPVRLGSKKFAALHATRVKAGVLLRVPRGVEVAAPFEVFHLCDGDEVSIFPHTLVIAEDLSRVTVLEHFVSADPEQRGFACGVNDLVLKPGSKLNYVSVQEWSPKFVSIQVNATVVAKDASALNLAVNLGGKYSRLESVSRLVGGGARSDMLALSIARGEQEFDQRTLQDHLHADTTSDLLYKNALYDEARTIFSGLIKVEPGAHRTDAYQKVRNLLLSDDAEANSMPGLEILADDVRCTHGATSGQVEPEELFYLKSRGIPDLAAKQLIVRGFLNEVVDRVQHPELTEYLHQQIASR